MSSVFGVLHHFWMRLQPDKNQKKIGDKKLTTFTAESIICPISRVRDVINEFGFRCFASFLDALIAR